MDRYVYEKKYLEQYICDFYSCSPNEDIAQYDEMVKITDLVFGYVFQSDMTAIIVAILSKNKEELINITVDDIMHWFEVGNENEDSFDWFHYKNLPLYADEDSNAPLNYMEEAIIFVKPLNEIYKDMIERYPEYANNPYKITQLICESASVIGIKKKYLFTSSDVSTYPSCEIIAVKEWDHWRF